MESSYSWIFNSTEYSYDTWYEHLSVTGNMIKHTKYCQNRKQKLIGNEFE